MVEEIKEDATADPVNGEEAAVEEAQDLEAAQILISAEEWEAVQAELAAARAQVDENLDGWQRALADFSNYKKRLEREKNTVQQNAMGKVILHYLAIVDDLELALQNRPQSGDGATWAEGIELILRKLQSFLDAEGVTRIEAEGEEFDPTFHEAIVMEPSADHESGHVIGAVQTGYMLGERVLRPAKVRVAQ